MFDEYLEPPHVERPDFLASAVLVLVNSVGTPSSTFVDQDAPSPSYSSSSSALHSPCLHQGIAAESTLIDKIPFAHVDNDPFINIFFSKPNSEASSSGDASSAESTYKTCCPEETVTKCHTMPKEPALNHTEPSSDDKHVLDGLDQ
nr:hypothetical protein [Tanacetum cinerariifolium]